MSYFVSFIILAILLEYSIYCREEEEVWFEKYLIGYQIR